MVYLCFVLFFSDPRSCRFLYAVWSAENFPCIESSIKSTNRSLDSTAFAGLPGSCPLYLTAWQPCAVRTFNHSTANVGYVQRDSLEAVRGRDGKHETCQAVSVASIAFVRILHRYASNDRPYSPCLNWSKMLVGWSGKGGLVLARCSQTSPISSLATITKMSYHPKCQFCQCCDSLCCIWLPRQ